MTDTQNTANLIAELRAYGVETHGAQAQASLPWRAANVLEAAQSRPISGDIAAITERAGLAEAAIAEMPIMVASRLGGKATAAKIAQSAADIPALIAEVARLTAERDRLAGIIAEASKSLSIESETRLGSVYKALANAQAILSTAAPTTPGSTE